MASTFNRQSLDVAKSRPLDRSKLDDRSLIKPNARRMLISISQMSPEAQRAMTMTQEDAKENMANTLNIKDQTSFQSHGHSRHTNCISVEHDAQIGETGRNYRSCSRLLARPPGFNVRAFPRSRRVTTSSFETSILTGTSRSRSTLSTTERNNSISDNTDSCYNYNKVNRILNQNNFQNKDSDSEGNNPTISQHEKTVIQNLSDESNNNNISEVNNNNTEFHTQGHINRCEGVMLPEIRKNSSRPESFVLALDRALEENCISRLSGDITNTAGISELGKVRALDGGRLTNAQEVVVNVRYDDDRELVFHDNDEENLNNAKATSHIKINLWMEYNEGFQPEDITNEIVVFTTNDNQGKNGQAVTCSDPTTSLLKLRGRSVNRLTSNRINTSLKQTNKIKWPVLKTDLNNNKTICKSKTNSFINSRRNSPSMNRSTEMLDGNKRHVSFFKTGIKK